MTQNLLVLHRTPPFRERSNPATLQTSMTEPYPNTNFATQKIKFFFHPKRVQVMFCKYGRFISKIEPISCKPKSFTRRSSIKANVKKVVLKPGIPDGFYDPLFGKEAYRLIEAGKENYWKTIGDALTFPSEFTRDQVNELLREALLIESTFKFLNVPTLINDGIPTEVRKRGFLNCIAFIRGFDTIEETEKYLQQINFVPDFFASGKQMDEHFKDCDLYGEYMSEASLSTLLGSTSTNGLEYDPNFKNPMYKWFVAYEMAKYLFDEGRLFDVLLSRSFGNVNQKLVESTLASIRLRVQNHRPSDKMFNAMTDNSNDLNTFFVNSLAHHVLENPLNRISDISARVNQLGTYSFNSVSAREIIEIFCNIRNDLRQIAVDMVIHARSIAEEQRKKEYSLNWEIFDNAYLSQSNADQIDSSLSFLTNDNLIDNTPSVITKKYLPQEFDSIQQVIDNLINVISTWDQSIVQFELSIRAGEISRYPIKRTLHS